MKLINLLLRAGAHDDPKPIIETAERTYTRAQAIAEVQALIGHLRQAGVDSGERVVAIIEPNARGLFLLAAASAMGLRLIMPYNLAMGAIAEWLDVIEAARPAHIVAFTQDRALLDELGQRHLAVVPDRDTLTPLPSRPAAFIIDDLQPVPGFLTLFSSGTSGAPKPISIGESLVCARVLSVTQALQFSGTARALLTGLFNNTTGVIFAFGCLLHNACLVIPHKRDAAHWATQVADLEITHLMLRPALLATFLDAVAAQALSLSSLRVLAYGAAPVPAPVVERGRSLLSCQWVQGYGLTETFGPFCWLDEAAHRDGAHLGQPYCIGVPDHTAEVRVQAQAPEQPGVLEVRTALLMDGYVDFASGRVSEPPSWYGTGDLACFDSAGRLLLKGRQKRWCSAPTATRSTPPKSRLSHTSALG
ncbi:class I adenylate-forming enzyme family protein [Pseudomonas sp. KNUC1026]|uniref:class I adenylate-forming enzyme family protein n=1 Tax=Pseudomonas sp. KNUC1026 TaxID=2893890 RepID=UPI001F16528D|nr:AMP-binding protein [Pseudomonas sp. KNUC1026]UFH50203.1 AMP-binding protein [Pseudomonas sp. KNUC1026]